MPQEFWYPISGATHDLPAGYDDHANTGGANKNASTRVGGGRSGPATHDDATSYITDAGVGEQALNIDWPGPMLTWDGVFTANHRTRFVSGGSNNRYAVFVDAAAVAGANIWGSVSESSGGFVNTAQDVANGVNFKPGGVAWVAADFASEQTIFAAMVGNVGCSYDTTSVWGEISYTPPSGGFVFLLQLAGAAALPFVGRMDFGQFTRYLSWRRAYHPRHTILTSDEVRRAWDEIRAYRHPRFFPPAVV